MSHEKYATRKAKFPGAMARPDNEDGRRCATCGKNPVAPGWNRCVPCLGDRIKDLAEADDQHPLIADDPIGAFVEEQQRFEEAAASVEGTTGGTGSGAEYVAWLESENSRLADDNIRLQEQLVTMNKKYAEVTQKIACGICGTEKLRKDMRLVSGGAEATDAQSWICDEHRQL